jgi:replicative DNA helicase
MSESQKPEFSIAFQRSLLARIFKDNDFYKKAVKIIKPDNFDTDSLQWICKKSINGSSTLNILLEELKSDKKNKIINEDLKKAIVEELKLICGRSNFDDAQYGLKKLKEFIDKQEISSGLISVITGLKSTGDIEYARKQLKKIAHTKEEDEFVKTVDLFNDKERRFNDREEKVKQGEIVFIPTGLTELDNDLKGPRLGQFWTFFGDTNMGKSALMAFMGTHTALKGYKTWHVVIEDELDMTLQRYDTSFTKIDFNKLTYCSYTPEEKAKIDKIFDLLKTKRDKYLYVTKVEEGFTMDDIEAEFERLINIEGFRPDVVIIDSPYNMEPVFKRESYRLNCAQIYREIRKFTRKHRTATFTSDQTKQEMKGKKADTDASSETYDKARIADGFLTMNQTRMQRKENVIELWVAKMKDRKKHVSYHLRPNIGVMKFESIKMGENGDE